MEHVMTKQKHHSTHPKDAAQPLESAEDRLDEALEESFPASDPIAVDVGEARRLRRWPFLVFLVVY
jgi:hypothetical protein